MNCEEIQQNLELYVLECLPEEQHHAVRAHLASCPACRKKESEYLSIAGNIKTAVSPVKVDSRFEKALSESIGREIAGTRRRPILKWLAAAGSIAALIALGLAIWQPSLQSDRHPSANTAAPAAATPPVARQTAAPLLWQRSGALSIALSSADGMVVRGERMYHLLNEGNVGRVVAVNIRTGTQLWCSEISSSGYLAADDERAYCLSHADGSQISLVALDGQTGREVWRSRADSADRIILPVKPVLLDGLGICWTGNAKITLLDSSSGKPIWTRTIDGEGLLSCPVTVGDSLYIASSSALYCLRARDGSTEWRKPVSCNSSGFVRPMIAAAKDAVYMAARDQAGRDSLYKIGFSDDSANWIIPMPYVKWLTVADGRLYIRGQNIQALDAATGRTMWSFKAAGCGPVSYYDGLIYFVDSGDRAGRLVALNALAGNKAWELDGISSCDAFCKVGETGYIKTLDGVVHAIALSGM